MSGSNPTEGFPITERSRVRREHDKGSYSRADVHTVLDAAPVAHIGYVIDGAPFVTPTLHWRESDRIFWHGSAASRFLREADSMPVCVTCSLIDGYVLARSIFNHSVNYRSVMAFGTARRVEETADKLAALRALSDGLFPDRWDSLRPMTAQEFKATDVLYMDIEEASVKMRDGPPGDPNESDVPVWAGVLPLRTVWGAPQSAPELPASIRLPPRLMELVKRPPPSTMVG